MIPVQAQPEPKNFDMKVRQKGIQYLKREGLPLTGQLPAKTKLKPYWRDCMSDLYHSYGGFCAYLGVFFEEPLGAGTVDHFVAQSSDASQVYEWSNYRLACSRMNSRKQAFDDLLDPFYLAPGLFHLELSSGRIYANPRLEVRARRIVELTIERLKLDDGICRRMRYEWFQAYVQEDISGQYLKKKFPFVWMEVHRQGLLRLTEEPK